MNIKTGYIYILTNPALPGMLKIGKTERNPLDRIRELSSSTSVPTPFQLAYYQPSVDIDNDEKRMFSFFENKRVSDNREFFKLSLYQAAIYLDAITNHGSNFEPATPFAELFATFPERPDGQLNKKEIAACQRLAQKLERENSH